MPMLQCGVRDERRLILTRLDVRAWLESARFSNVRIEALEELIIRKEARLTGCTPGGLSGMPGGGKQGDWTYTVAQIEGYREELKRITALREEVGEAIRALGNIKHVTAMELYYLRNMSEADIARVMGYDVKTVGRWRDLAIAEIAKNKSGVW